MSAYYHTARADRAALTVETRGDLTTIRIESVDAPDSLTLSVDRRMAEAIHRGLALQLSEQDQADRELAAEASR